MVLTVGEVSLGHRALAQTAPAQGTRAFNIPAQPLADALVQFGYQSGLQVAADGNATAAGTSTAVSGNLTPQQALTRLLTGTGLIFQFTGANTVQVQRPAVGPSGALQLDPVQVQGFPVPSQAMIDNLPPPYAGGQVATGSQLGLLGNRSVMDTPFNQTSYTAQKAQDQQARTVKDVLADDPSIRSMRSSLGAGDDNVYIRGFSVSNTATAYGGLYGILPTNSISAEIAERVEVLKGPGVMLNGMAPNFGFIGGTINVVPKRAPDTDLTQATASFMSAGQVGGHVDVGRRFGDDKQWGLRFNGAFRAGQTSVEWNTDQLGLGLLGLDFRGERVRISADLGYQDEYIGGVIPFIGLNPGVAIPQAPNAASNPGQPWGYFSRKDAFGVIRAEVDISEDFTAYASFGAHDNRFNLLGPGIVTVTNVSGTATGTPTYTNLYNSYFSGEAGVRGSFDTGPIRHEVAVTGSAFQQISGSGRATGPAFATNLYDATVTAQPGLTANAPLASTTTLTSVGFADTLTAAEKRVQLTAGLRFQRVQSANYSPVTGAPTSYYDASAVSPSVALVVKPFWDNVSIYGNWIQGLQQGYTVSPPFANAGEVFAPFLSTQFEAGVKVDWGRFTTTMSLFQITQPSAVTNLATNTLVGSGLQINRGLELNFFGELTPGLRLLGGAMFLNATLANQNGPAEGMIAPFSPGVQFNIAGEWDLPFAQGLTVTGRTTYTGPQYIDTSFPRRELAEWVRFDVGARYAFENPGAKGKMLVARFNVDNVLGANYWEGGQGTLTFFTGKPRTFRLALTADF
jgi:iron complex outermembrane receptor protein